MLPNRSALPRKWLCFLVCLLGFQVLASAQQIQVYDGNKFYRVDDERLRSLRIREWQIRLYNSAADHAAGRIRGLITGSSADHCLEQLRKRREEYTRWLRFTNAQDDGTGGGWRYVSQPFAVVDRGALSAMGDEGGTESNRVAIEAERRRQADVERRQRQAQQAEARQRERAAQQERLRQQAESARQDRERRMEEVERISSEREQSEEKARIIERTVQRLERLQSEADAYNRAFTQIGELIQAQMERDQLRDEIRDAKRAEERARSEATREQRAEQRELERLEQLMEERAAAQDAEEVSGSESLPTESPRVSPSRAAVSEIGSQPALDSSEPYASPGTGATVGSSGRAAANPSLAAPRSDGAPSVETADAVPLASPQPSKFPEYGRLLKSDPKAREERSTAGSPLADLLGAADADEAAVLGRVLSSRGEGARQAVSDGTVLRGLLDDVRLARDVQEQVGGERAGSDTERSVLGRLFDRYASERDGRIAGNAAPGVAIGRAIEGAADQFQQDNADRIPESVRAEGDAWRMLFARGASGDLVGHVKGHVEFAERWVFDRIDAATRATPVAPQPGSGSAGSSPPRNMPSSSLLDPAERDTLDVAQQAARAAANASSLRERSVQLRRVLRATSTLPLPPQARRSVLYLRAAAAMDLADGAVCREVRSQIRSDGADMDPNEQERALLRALEEQCK